MIHPDVAERAALVARALDDKQASDIVVLDVGDILSIVDVFVIASAGNTRLVRTLVETVEERITETRGDKPRVVEGLDSATWVLMDYGDVVVHVFLDETREFYALERLWADAPRYDFDVESGELVASEANAS
jgi:ribosome-associated protein